MRMMMLPATALLMLCITPAVAQDAQQPPLPSVPAAPQGQNFSADGFSVTFPEGWKVKKITQGMVSATSTPASAVQSSVEIYYGEIPANAPQADKNKFRALQKKHSVNDYISKNDLKNSHWHSKVTTETLEGGISVEKVDVEQLVGKKPVCSFYREYHTPRVELHLTYSQRSGCSNARTDFSNFTKSLTWNR